MSSFKPELDTHGSSLNGYLETYTTAKQSEHSHTNMFPCCAYFLQESAQARFFEKYNKALENGEKLHITEKHRDQCSILIDLDFRFKNEEEFTHRQYTINTLEKFIHVYINELSKYLDKDTYEIYVMEKSKPKVDSAKNLIKDGVHIIISNVVTTLSLQHHVRDAVLEKLAFMLEETRCTNTISDIFDKAVIDINNWLMCGSSKPHNEPYLVSHHYTFKSVTALDTNQNPMDWVVIENEVFTKEPWRYTVELSIRNKLARMMTPINPDKIEIVGTIECAYQEKKLKKIIINNSQQLTVNKMQHTTEELEIVEQLMDLLNPQRASDYHTWIRVGWCARTIDYRLLDKWIEFSRKSPKFGGEDECTKYWEFMKETGLGMGTMIMWAKQDNPDEYEKIMAKSMHSCMVNSGSGTDYDIALVIHKKFRQDYICASIKNKAWYEFKKHRWNRCEDGYAMKIRLSTELSKDYISFAKSYDERINEAAQSNDKETEEFFTKKKKKYSDIAGSLKRTDFKEKMLKESAAQFFNEQFEENLKDMNPNLIGFENGVYDMNIMEFREGHPEDYISFSTKINYAEFSHDDPIVHEINAFMAQVVPNKDVREYVMTVLATMLDGKNRDEKFYIWVGHGSNGKSKMIELMSHILGDYLCNFNVSLLTSKRTGSGQTNSELVRAKGRRLAVLQEPEEGERMNVGFMKELSGGDKIITRGLYKDSVEFKPMFKMILTCNHLPTIPSDDGGTWRRIRLIEFTSKFCDNPNPDNPNEFPIDRDLSAKFELWKEPFMWMLLERLKDYRANGIHEPEEVMKCTRDYQRNNDTLGEFQDAFIKKKEGGYLELDTVYEEYKEWYKTEQIPGKILRRKGLKDYLDKNMSKSESIRRKVVWKDYELNCSFTGNLIDADDIEQDDL